MSDARDRRRQHAEESKKADPLGLVKKFRVPLVIVIIWLAIVGYNVAASKGYIGDPASGCPGHWHSMTEVYIDDGNEATNDRLVFDPARNSIFRDSSDGFHLHDASGRIHMHPGTERCIETGDVYSFLGLDLAKSSIAVSSQYNYGTNIAGTFSNNDTHELRIYERDWNYANSNHGDAEDWRRITDIPAFLEDQIGNGDQVLVTYVAKDAPDSIVDEQKASVGFIGDSYVPGTDSIFMPILAATMFAGLGIIIWRKMTAGLA